MWETFSYVNGLKRHKVAEMILENADPLESPDKTKNVQMNINGKAYIEVIAYDIDQTTDRVILKLNNKNQKLFYSSDHFYGKFNSKKLLLFDRNPKMTEKLVKIDFLFIKENIKKYK